jgi:hypothetical protein
MGFEVGETDKEGNKLYRPFLVTNRHVVRDERTAINEPLLWAKFNKGDEVARYKLDLVKDGKPIWLTHESFDVAAIPVNLNLLQQEGAEFAFIPEERMPANGQDARDGRRGRR